MGLERIEREYRHVLSQARTTAGDHVVHKRYLLRFPLLPLQIIFLLGHFVDSRRPNFLVDEGMMQEDRWLHRRGRRRLEPAIERTTLGNSHFMLHAAAAPIGKELQ
jgi:hypothetical protein